MHLEVWPLFTLLSFRLWTRAPMLVCCPSYVRVLCPVRPYVPPGGSFVCLFEEARETREDVITPVRMTAPRARIRQGHTIYDTPLLFCTLHAACATVRHGVINYTGVML